MKWIKTIASEGYGLFVDDASYALSILAWVIATWVLRWTAILPPQASAIALFLGLALILATSAYRRAHKG